ncbi:MAG: hypothetical protein ACR2MT_08340 [Aurantibacter sp.]
MNDFVKRISTGLISGLVAGMLIIGMGGRLAMRIIALLGGQQGGFSWGGTLDVVAFGLITGAISGVIYGMIEKYGFSTKLLNGGLYGILLFVALLVLPIEGKGAAKAFPDLQLSIYLIFGVTLIVYGIILAYAYKRCLRLVTKSNPNR